MKNMEKRTSMMLILVMLAMLIHLTQAAANANKETTTAEITTTTIESTTATEKMTSSGHWSTCVNLTLMLQMFFLLKLII